MDEFEVWTFGYFPFTMGGNINRPIKTAVMAEQIKLSEKYNGRVFQIGNNWFVAEETSHAIVGCKKTKEEVVNMVINDISIAKENIIKMQIEEAIEDFKNAEFIEYKEFERLISR